MSRQVPVDQFEGLGLLPLIILVKVAGIGPWIEALLPERQYNADAVAARRRKEAEELGISFGIRRDGMDDTGCNVICNRQFVWIDALLAGFAMERYKITEASWFWREDERGRKRFLQLAFTMTGDAISLPKRVSRMFAVGVVPFVNVWANVRESGEELFRLDTINVPSPRMNVVAEEELHCSFSPGRYTYLTTAPHR